METYEISGKHLYLPMSINAGCIAVILIAMLVLYKAPRFKKYIGTAVCHVTAPAFDDNAEQKDLKIVDLSSKDNWDLMRYYVTLEPDELASPVTPESPAPPGRGNNRYHI